MTSLARRIISQVTGPNSDWTGTVDRIYFKCGLWNYERYNENKSVFKMFSKPSWQNAFLSCILTIVVHKGLIRDCLFSLLKPQYENGIFLKCKNPSNDGFPLTRSTFMVSKNFLKHFEQWHLQTCHLHYTLHWKHWTVRVLHHVEREVVLFLTNRKLG